MFRHHVIAAIVAALMSAGTGAYVIHYEAALPPIVVNTASAKLHAEEWPGLSDDESVSLVAALGKLDKKTVSIFCAAPSCKDLAEDFGDAFTASGWLNGVERPIVDTNVGVNVGPDVLESHSLAAAIETAVNHRFQVGIVSARIEPDRLAVDIGRKP